MNEQKIPNRWDMIEPLFNILKDNGSLSTTEQEDALRKVLSISGEQDYIFQRDNIPKWVYELQWTRSCDCMPNPSMLQ